MSCSDTTLNRSTRHETDFTVARSGSNSSQNVCNFADVNKNARSLMTSSRPINHHQYRHHHHHHQTSNDSSARSCTNSTCALSRRNEMGSNPSSSSSSSSELPIVFWPPDINWQRAKAKLFSLPVRQGHWFNADRHAFPSNAAPKMCEAVAGDGNCLFRSISFWITGSEMYHLDVRDTIVQEIHDHAQLYSVVTSNHSIANYLKESQMDEEGVWGSEVEIFVAATVLKTPIAVYAAFGDRYLWQVFKPLERSQSDEKCMLYLQNTSNHFEPVTEV